MGMAPNVRYFWDEPIDHELIRKSATAAFSFDDDKVKWDKLWDWRYVNNPLSDKVYAAYIMEDETVACFYAISPIPILTKDNSVINAGLAVTGFTHPDFQGRGYYSELYNQTQKVLADMGFACLLAFDNHNSHYPEVKYLNWRDIGVLTNFSLNCDNIKPLTNRHTDIKIVKQELSDELLRELSTFHTNSAQFSVQRSFKYLKWRLMENPINKYQARVLYAGTDMLACAIYKMYGDTGCDIMEMFYRCNIDTEIHEFAYLLMHDLAVRERKQINMWSQLQSAEHLFLEKIGFEERCFSTYFVCNTMQIGHEILDIRNWHYRFMDSDVY
ncbi:hypothetical protein MASR2M64_02620 [Candidatus Cloacimonadota bacterium]